MGVFDVRFSAAADEDLGGLLGFLLDRAKTVEDLHEAELAISAISAISGISGISAIRSRCARAGQAA